MLDDVRNTVGPFQTHILPGGERLRYQISESDPAATTIFNLLGRTKDIESFDKVRNELLARNLNVIVPELRNQGESHRELGGAMRQHDHIIDFDIHVRDILHFYQHVVRPYAKGPIAIMAHSVGALHASCLLADHDPDIIAGIYIAPLFELPVLHPRFKRNAAKAVSRFMVRRELGRLYAWGQHDFDDRDRKFEGNIYTADREEFEAQVRRFDAPNSLHKIGGVTWGWLYAYIRSLEKMERPGYLERIHIPVLSVTGANDVRTPPKLSAPYLARFKRAHNVIIPKASHDDVLHRPEAWDHLDQFCRNLKLT